MAKYSNGPKLQTTTSVVFTSENWLDDFTASGISQELALANVRWIEGEEALEIMTQFKLTELSKQKVSGFRSSYVTAAIQEFLGRYQEFEDGGWVAYGVGDVPYFKPATPRFDENRQREIKYETAVGMPATPLFPDLSPKAELFQAIWGIEATWPDILANPHIPVAITEGLKKALALIELGIPAVAVRGVAQWHPKGEKKKLWPELAELFAGRQTCIAFDQDEKLVTKANVSRQARLLGNAVERLKQPGSPRFITWDGTQGKGIDDVLVNLEPEDRLPWLRDRMDKALNSNEQRRQESLAQARNILAAPTPQPDRETTGEYLPELPELVAGTLHWLSATMNSGKTYRMGRDWVTGWRQTGGVVLVLSPLNSLGQQTAKDWGLPHIHDYYTDPDSQQALEADISHSGGLVCCLNSIHRAWGLIPQNAPVLLIIDEAAQVLTDAAQGGTLKGEWANRWENTIAMMQRAAQTGAIAIAEDGLDSHTINLVRQLSGCQQVIGISHTKELEPWDCTIYRATPLSAYRGKLLAQLQTGETILYVTTSQNEARRLAHWAGQNSIDYERIDSQTNENRTYTEFFETPDTWLQQRKPQLLILSPSAKTGLSIEGGVCVENAYFDSVWGYFPALDTDTWKQLLGRYRPAVPRFIWAPAYIAPGPDEAPKIWGITRGLKSKAAHYATYGTFEQAPQDDHDQAIQNYLAARGQRRWAQKVQGADSLLLALEQAGHRVRRMTSGIQGDKSISELWKGIKEELAQQDADYHASLEIDSTVHTPQWAMEALNSIDTTYEKRCRATKVRIIDRFPGLAWDSSELWYEAVFCPRQSETKDRRPSPGPLAPGAALWAEADYCEALWANDAKEAERILTQRLKAAHLLPSQALNSMAARLFKPHIEKLLAAGFIQPGGEIELAIKKIALKYRNEISKTWRLTIDEEMPEETIANKIARKFGLIIERDHKVRVDGRQRWITRITASKTWLALVAARQWALGGTNPQNGAFNKFVPPSPDEPVPPPDQGVPSPKNERCAPSNSPGNDTVQAQ